ncbi:MAG TPA: permease [Nevskia sp.]|nr:permease [Nevskia sp.]
METQGLLDAAGQALRMALLMGWQIFWGISLGFLLAAVIEVAVPKSRVAQALPDASPRSLLRAGVFGAASSSCSYAAVAIARSLFRKGADFTAAIAFQFASTNLVLELGILLALLMGWRFTLAGFVGGVLMIGLLALLFRWFLRAGLVAQARREADRGVAGKMEGHAAMSLEEADGGFWQRLFSARGFTAVSHAYVMNWTMLWKDMLLGLALAGAVSAWVPHQAWSQLFLAGHPRIAAVWGPLIAPLVAVASFTCSIGNVPLAAVLWNGGISFGGVIAFLFADLIIIPILDILRKYYGWRMMWFLLATSYAAMVAAAWLVELLFAGAGLVPQQHAARIAEMQVRFNYTAVLNLVLLLLGVVLLWRFLKTGGRAMLRQMQGGAAGHHAHAHHGH